MVYKNEYLEQCIKEVKGSKYLIGGYFDSKELETENLVIDNLGFIYSNEEELEKFKSELIKANIKEFVLTESGSGLMEIIHALDSVGIKIKGLTTITTRRKYWDDKVKKGLIMQRIE